MSSIGTANIAGVASGLNFNSIVSQLMAVEQQQVTSLQTQQTQQQLIQTALGTLSTDMTALRTQAQALSDPSTFLAYASSLTSNTTTDPTTLLSVTPGSTAAPGTHTIQISNIASAQQLVSGNPVVDANTTLAVTSSTTALGISGSFTITGQASSAQTVTVSSSDSLSDIVTKINALNSGSNATGVTASILQASASGASTGDFRLVLTADNTGSTGIGLAGADLSTGGALQNLNMSTAADANAYNQPQQALDANIIVDGVTVTRSSNTITDAIPGYTIDLLKNDTTSTTVTVTTAADNTAIKAKIQGFVDAYNKIMSFINSQMAFDTKTQQSGILAGNSTVRSIQSQLSQQVLQSVSGLASDRNSLPLIGVAPDQNGQLQIDSTTLDGFLNTDPTAVAKVFGASGSSTNSSLTFLTYGLNSTSSSYAVNITQAATQASVTGTNALAGTLAGNEAFSVTDGFGHQTDSSFGLTSGQSLAQIVSALNTEFGTVYTEQHKMSTALTDTSTASAATSATTLSNLNLGVAAGDTISITGTTRGGTAVNSTFTVVDPATDTIGDLLSAIQVAYNQQVTATVDASGNINITDNTSGDSSLTMNLTYNGAGTLNFGTDTVVTQGRYAMALSASATTGNQLQITSNNYGASQSISVTEASGTNYLGLNGATSTGTDVAGTIGGLAATGAGQILTGSSGSVDGMALLYTGSATGSIGTMAVSMGIGSVYDGLIDTYTNAVSGLIQNDINSAQTTYDNLQTQIDAMNARIKLETETLTKSFLQMEQVIGQLNSTNQWISQQFSSTAAPSSGTSTA